MRPTSCVMALAVPFNMAMTYLFIFHLDLGFIGSPLALVASWTFMMTSSLLYIRFAHVLFPVHCPQDPFACWGGWSRKAFKKWAAFLKIGLPAAGQICIEWWAIELVVFEAGLFGVAEQGIGGCGPAAIFYWTNFLVFFGGERSLPPTTVGYPPTTVGYPPTAVGYSSRRWIPPKPALIALQVLSNCVPKY